MFNRHTRLREAVALAALLTLVACGGGTTYPAAVTPAITSIASQGTTLTAPSTGGCGIWRFPNATAQSQYIITFSNLPNPSELDVAVDGQILPKVSLSSPIAGAGFQFDFSSPTTAKVQPMDATAFAIRVRNRSLDATLQGTQRLSDAVVINVRTGTFGGCGLSSGRDIPGGRIAFVSDRSGSREVWIMNGDPSWTAGVNLMKLSNGVSEHPVIGPPQTYIVPATGLAREYKSNAYVGYESTRGGEGDIYASHVEGGNDGKWSNTAGPDTEPSIRRDSNDSVWINGGNIWGFITPPGANPAATSLVQITTQGNTPAPGNSSTPIFNPIGDAIVYARGGKLRTIRPLAAPFSSTPLTNPATFNIEKGQVFSRDGSKVAYIKDNKLFVVAATGGAEMPLNTANIGLDDHPSFSPDGTTIVFDSGVQGGPRQIYRVPAAGSAAPAALTTQGSNFAPTFGPNGAVAFVSTRDGNSEIYMMDINGGSQRNITNNPAADDQPSWR